MNIIIDLLKNGIADFEKAAEEFAKNPTKFYEYVGAVKKATDQIALGVIKETLEARDADLRKSILRKAHYSIVRKDSRDLVTSLGAITFERTLFKSKETTEGVYLLDRILGLEANKHLTEDAEVRLIEEAAQTSYRKAGKEICTNEDVVSKEAVKDLLHRLRFPEEKPAAEKRKVKHLFIDADEDHISLQFREQKGDLERDERGYKSNTLMGKLVYVYEGCEKEAPESKRHRLINPHYFSGVYQGSDNEKLWTEVWNYIENTYDTEYITKLYVNGDGANWIKSCKKELYKAVPVLDEFHMEKYLVKMTAHLMDSQMDAIQELKEVIKDGKKADFRAIATRIKALVDDADESRKYRIDECERYILSNWSGAKLRLSDRRALIGCSAEGHVSHMLSARMSSRPMGWSVRGADAMCRLRAYVMNGRSIIDLVRYQEKKDIKKAAGAEMQEVISAAKVITSERNKYGLVGKYFDTMQAETSSHTRASFYFHEHIKL